MFEEPYRSALARQACLDGGRLAASLKALLSTPNHHDIPRDFATQHAIAEHSIDYVLVSRVADHPALQPIRDFIASRLEAS